MLPFPALHLLKYVIIQNDTFPRILESSGFMYLPGGGAP